MRVFIFAAFLLASACDSAQKTGPVSEGEAPAASKSIVDEVAQPTEKQIENFGSLANYVDMTFRGAPTGDATASFVDIQKWEWGLGGNTILIRHALEDGSYGGDTHVYKDAKTGKLTYVYITNGGFHTVGEMIPRENGWVAEEEVSGHDNITRVRSTSVVDDTGVWAMNSEYLTDGEWVAGHSFEYAPTDDPLPTLSAE